MATRCASDGFTSVIHFCRSLLRSGEGMSTGPVVPASACVTHTSTLAKEQAIMNRRARRRVCMPMLYRRRATRFQRARHRKCGGCESLFCQLRVRS